MKLSDEDKKVLTEALRKTNNLPPMQGKVILNISPEGKVSTVELNIVRN
jgi:hypothetical protein